MPTARPEKALPAVGADAIEHWARARHGVRVILMVVQQTYGGFLNFYPHLHTLVSAGGLDECRVRWVHDLRFQKEEHWHELMLAWRFALLAYLDAAIKANVLNSERSADELAGVLKRGREQNSNHQTSKSAHFETSIICKTSSALN